MKKIYFFVSSFAFFVCASISNVEASAIDENADESCKVLEWNKNKFNKPHIYINKPGRYCLDRSYSFTCYPWSHGCGGEFISIRSDNVDIDFRGHTFSVAGTKGYIGIWGMGRNIRVHNGVIKGAGTGVYLRDGYGKAGDPVYSEPASPIEKNPVFSNARFVVESVRFVNVRAPILLSGAANIIRDNAIHAILENNLHPDGTPKFAGEEEPQVAILNYGPDVLIENNKITQETDNKGISAYTIYLRNASNSVIRNNRFRVSGTKKNTVAIGLSVSNDVLIEKNIFSEVETFIEKQGESSAREVGNESNSWWLF